LEGNSRDVIEVGYYPGIHMEGLRKPTKVGIRTFVVAVGIRTKYSRIQATSIATGANNLLSCRHVEGESGYRLPGFFRGAPTGRAYHFAPDDRMTVRMMIVMFMPAEYSLCDISDIHRVLILLEAKEIEAY
jgi:hypothetical protein